jgi:hypothetical protein
MRPIIIATLAVLNIRNLLTEFYILYKSSGDKLIGRVEKIYFTFVVVVLETPILALHPIF